MPKDPLKPIIFRKQDDVYESCLEIDLNHISKSVEDLLRKIVNEKLLPRDAIQTFLKRKIIQSPEQYDLNQHLLQSNDRLKKKADCIYMWVRDNVTETKDLIQFQQLMQRKRKKMQKKAQRIKQLTNSIAAKLQAKKLNEMLQTFKEEHEDNKIVIPSDPNYVMAKIKFAKCNKDLQQLSSIRHEIQRKNERRLEEWRKSIRQSK